MAIFKRLLGATVLGATAAALISKNYIYAGNYYEVPPFDPTKLPLLSKVKYYVAGSNDSIVSDKAYKICNPNNNPVIYDYSEKQLDTETTEKILAKYKTNEEMLGAMQKALFLGPTLWPHRFVISPYLKGKGENNRIAGFTYFEPALKKVDCAAQPKTNPFGIPILPKNDKLKYVWDAADIKKYNGPFDQHTIIFGMFDFLEYGTRSNGGYFNFAVGSDTLPDTMIHRVEYFKVKNDKGEDNLVFRLTNVTTLIPPKSPAPVDGTHGLHEFMTRTMVLDMVRGIEY